jgi:hypothetical protein
LHHQPQHLEVALHLGQRLDVPLDRAIAAPRSSLGLPVSVTPLKLTSQRRRYHGEAADLGCFTLTLAADRAIAISLGKDVPNQAKGVATFGINKESDD